MGKGRQNEALLIMHLSSLDNYTSLFGVDDGENLAYSIEEAMESHDGPIIIVDQAWSLHGRDSRPREEVYESIERIPANQITIIRHDESESADAWEDLYNELIPLLNNLGVSRVKIGGFWYDPEYKSGCAWCVGQRLMSAFQVKYDTYILASYLDEDEDDDDNS